MEYDSVSRLMNILQFRTYILYMNVNVHGRNNFWNLGLKKINGKMPAEKVLDILIEKKKVGCL